MGNERKIFKRSSFQPLTEQLNTENWQKHANYFKEKYGLDFEGDLISPQQNQNNILQSLLVAKGAEK